MRVIAGRDKGKTGQVLEVDRSTGKVTVEGVMMVKRHTRPNPSKQIKGGVAEKPMPIDVSNVMILTAGGVPTRVGYKIETSAARCAGYDCPQGRRDARQEVGPLRRLKAGRLESAKDSKVMAKKLIQPGGEKKPSCKAVWRENGTWFGATASGEGLSEER